MVWLSGISHRIAPAFLRRTGSGDSSADAPSTTPRKKQLQQQTKKEAVGILAFEAAKAMSRLLSLYKSLSDDEIDKLRSFIQRSEGVRYLNSADESALLRLAGEERVEELDRLVLVVARLGRRCHHPSLQKFDLAYHDLKQGYVDFPRLGFPLSKLGRKIARMEKLVAGTAELYSGLELLSEMEASDKKLQSWKSFSGPIAVQKQPDIEMFEQKLSGQRSLVRRMKETSLWTKTFDKVVLLMVHLACNVFVRICAVFGPYVAGLPRLVADGSSLLMRSHHLQATPRIQPSPVYSSGPIGRCSAPAEQPALVRNSGPILPSTRPKTEAKRDLAFYLGFGFSFDEEAYSAKSGKGPPPPAAAETTLGAAALAMRYANVIVTAEGMLCGGEAVEEEAKEELYNMLPARLRRVVRDKMRRGGGGGGGADVRLAAGWREAVEMIVGWLAPMARDTVRWQTERNVERQEFGSGPTVLRLQTLHYADREKAEAAIAEVLVGLSCICHHQNPRRPPASSSS